MTVISNIGTVFVSGFMMVWLTGWTAGGVFAWHAALAKDIATAVCVVWAVMTFAFTCNVFTLPGCAGPSRWLMLWLPFSLAVYAYFNISPAALQRLWRTWLRVETKLLMLIDFAKSFANWSQRSNLVPAHTVQISVCLVDGGEVLSDHEFLFRGYVFEIQAEVEAVLKAQKCQLLLGGDVLLESQRVCDAGIVSGCNLTAVILEEEQSVPDVEEDVKQAPPVFVRCFLLVWLTGWTLGEVVVIHSLASSLLSC